MKLTLIAGQYLANEYRGRYHAKGKGLARRLADACDEVLAHVDVVAMPTTPQTAHEVDPEVSRVEAIGRRPRDRPAVPGRERIADPHDARHAAGPNRAERPRDTPSIVNVTQYV